MSAVNRKDSTFWPEWFMSDLSAIRSRRRPRGIEFDSSPAAADFPPAPASTAINFDAADKNHGFQAPFYAPFSTVINASTTQLWNSAQAVPIPLFQEAFSSFQPATYLPSSSSFSQFPQASSYTQSPEPEILIPVFEYFGKDQQEPFNMPSRDRTSEFRAITKSMQMRSHGNGSLRHATPQNPAIAESLVFNQAAKRIGRDLSHTCAKMERLAELAKKKSLFNDGAEVEQLSRDVTDSIKNLNRQIGQLQELSKQTNRQAHLSKQAQGHSNLVVVGLQSKLAHVSKDFQTVLEVRTENLKAQKSRRQMFSAAEPMPMTLPTSSNAPMSRSRLVEDDISAGGSVAVDMDYLSQHQSQQLLHADQSTAYAQSRSNMMETIEASISELGQIFTQLASLVSQQGEMIERIDSNVEETAINIDAAHSEIVRYFHSISQNRWLMIKVFGVLMVFFIIFVMFLT